MSVDRLQCPSCGAPLVPEDRGFFSCRYCGTRLKAKEGSAAESVATPGSVTEDDPLLAQRTAYMELIEQHSADLAEYERLRRKRTALRKGDAEGDSSGPQGYASLLLALSLLIVVYALVGAEGVAARQVAGLAVALVPLAVFLVALARAGGKGAQGRAQGRRKGLARTRQRLGELEARMARRRERIAALEVEIDRAGEEL